MDVTEVRPEPIPAAAAPPSYWPRWFELAAVAVWLLVFWWVAPLHLAWVGVALLPFWFLALAAFRLAAAARNAARLRGGR